MKAHFGNTVGLSDHSIGVAIPIAATAMGANIIEKHLTLSRLSGGLDSAFSLEPHEFGEMVKAIRSVEQAIGSVSYATASKESNSRRFRRSLYIIKDIKNGNLLNEHNVRSIRPGLGLHTRNLDKVIGRTVTMDVSMGTPLTWGILGGE